MSPSKWNIKQIEWCVFPCSGLSVPKQSGKELKTETSDCVSAGSAAAKLRVYIPLLYCVTSCDKDDSHCSQDDGGLMSR